MLHHTVFCQVGIKIAITNTYVYSILDGFEPISGLVVFKTLAFIFCSSPIDLSFFHKSYFAKIDGIAISNFKNS